MIAENKYVRFDWAVKRMLRDKANYGVLEGLITVLLGQKVTITAILESEANQDQVDDKYNRVDIKALNAAGEIILVEVQLTRQLYYLERILYGVAKTLTEHINANSPIKTGISDADDHRYEHQRSGIQGRIYSTQLFHKML